MNAEYKQNPTPCSFTTPMKRRKTPHSITLLITRCELAEKPAQQHILCLVTLLNEATRTGIINVVNHLPFRDVVAISKGQNAPSIHTTSSIFLSSSTAKGKKDICTRLFNAAAIFLNIANECPS